MTEEDKKKGSWINWEAINKMTEEEKAEIWDGFLDTFGKRKSLESEKDEIICDAKSESGQVQ